MSEYTPRICARSERNARLVVPEPVICEAGYYQDEIGQSSCKVCPSGSYCLYNTTTPVECPPGSYCPDGTRFGTEYLCPNGTYSNSLSLTNVTECTDCTPGYYCGSPGLTAPTAKCREGYFCGGGSSVATPHESGETGFQISYIGETCVETTNTTINDICPPGHYCPVGSDAPVQCPPGTNSSSTGLVNVTDCPPCTRGYYCPLNGTVYAVRDCLAGSYCPAGTGALTNVNLCPTGAYCPTGSPAPELCEPGMYQDEIGQSSCKVCPSGSYCLQNTTTPVECPPGSYCPAGTRFGTEYLCPNGTYSNSLSLTNVTECTDCTPGYYCGSPGLTAPTAKCREGYFCGGGSPVAAPHESGETGFQISYIGETCVETTNTTINDICPPGHYCPVGSDAPVQCPPGTNSSSTGLVNVTDCPPCTRGYYCPLNGTVYAVRDCLVGSYCPAGTGALTNVNLCPTGAYCPTGSPAPELCEPGMYQDEIGQSSCKVCPSGSYCLQNTTTPVECPPGSYCPAGTRFGTEYLCPNGTYSNSLSLTNVTECTDCTPGYYCGSPGLTAPTAKCREGYFCGGGSPVATPHASGASPYQISYIGETCVEISNTTLNDVCPPGHYCPEGSDAPVQCPPGTNSSSTGLRSDGDCPPCVAGYYCPLNATVHATRLCPAGYYCPAGTAFVSDDDFIMVTRRRLEMATLFRSKTLATIPTPEPTMEPTVVPTAEPTIANTSMPTIVPTAFPTIYPTMLPTDIPSFAPSAEPTFAPTPSDLRLACPVGSYCPLGSSQPIPCDAGYYQDLMGPIRV